MKVIWKLDTATVRQVYETMLERRRIAYTTVMTMMNILEQKGYLKKQQGDKAYVYQPAQPQKAGDPVDGAGVRQPRVQRLRRTAAGPSGGGPVSNRKGPRGNPANHQNLTEAIMSALADILGPAVYNLLAWTAQAAVLALAAALIGRVLPHPRGRLLFLAECSAGGAPAAGSRAVGETGGAGTDGVSGSPGARHGPRRRAVAISFSLEARISAVARRGRSDARLLWIGVGLARLRAYRSSARRLDHPPVPFARGMCELVRFRNGREPGHVRMDHGVDPAAGAGAGTA